MNKLIEFSYEKYIDYLEEKFNLYDDLDHISNKIHYEITASDNFSINYDFCIKVKRLIEMRVKEVSYISNYNVNFIAMGIFRICIEPTVFDEKTEFITINIY